MSRLYGIRSESKAIQRNCAAEGIGQSPAVALPKVGCTAVVAASDPASLVPMPASGVVVEMGVVRASTTPVAAASTPPTVVGGADAGPSPQPMIRAAKLHPCAVVLRIVGSPPCLLRSGWLE